VLLARGGPTNTQRRLQRSAPRGLSRSSRLKDLDNPCHFSWAHRNSDL
jgi:hypothetical protein